MQARKGGLDQLEGGDPATGLNDALALQSQRLNGRGRLAGDEAMGLHRLAQQVDYQGGEDLVRDPANLTLRVTRFVGRTPEGKDEICLLKYYTVKTDPLRFQPKSGYC